MIHLIHCLPESVSYVVSMTKATSAQPMPGPTWSFSTIYPSWYDWFSWSALSQLILNQPLLLWMCFFALVPYYGVLVLFFTTEFLTSIVLFLSLLRVHLPDNVFCLFLSLFVSLPCTVWCFSTEPWEKSWALLSQLASSCVSNWWCLSPSGKFQNFRGPSFHFLTLLYFSGLYPLCLPF